MYIYTSSYRVELGVPHIHVILTPCTPHLMSSNHNMKSSPEVLTSPLATLIHTFHPSTHILMSVVARQAMRHALMHPEEVLLKGKAARQLMIDKYSPQVRSIMSIGVEVK